MTPPVPSGQSPPPQWVFKVPGGLTLPTSPVPSLLTSPSQSGPSHFECSFPAVLSFSHPRPFAQALLMDPRDSQAQWLRVAVSNCRLQAKSTRFCKSSFNGTPPHQVSLQLLATCNSRVVTTEPIEPINTKNLPSSQKVCQPLVKSMGSGTKLRSSTAWLCQLRDFA